MFAVAGLVFEEAAEVGMFEVVGLVSKEAEEAFKVVDHVSKEEALEVSGLVSEEKVGAEGFEVVGLVSEDEAEAFKVSGLVPEEEDDKEEAFDVTGLVSKDEVEAVVFGVVGVVSEEEAEAFEVAGLVSGEEVLKEMEMFEIAGLFSEEAAKMDAFEVVGLVTEEEEKEEEAGVFEVFGLVSNEAEAFEVVVLVSKEEAFEVVAHVSEKEAFRVVEEIEVPMLVSKVELEEAAFKVINVAASISEEKEAAAFEEDRKQAFEEINVAAVISEEEVAASTEEIKANEIAAENHEDIDQHLLESLQLENLCGLSSKSAEHFAISNLTLSDHEDRAVEVIKVDKENTEELKESAIAHISPSTDSYPAWKRRNPFLMEQIKGLNMKARRIGASKSYSEVSSNVVTPVVPHVKYSIGSIGHDAQHAKMKDIAVPRAIELQEEKEERTQAQKISCLAKLEELNNQTLALSFNESRSQLSRIESRYTVPNQQAGTPYWSKSTNWRPQTFHDRTSQRQPVTDIQQSSNGSWRESLGVSSDSSDRSFTRRPPVHPRSTSASVWMEKSKP